MKLYLESPVKIGNKKLGLLDEIHGVRLRRGRRRESVVIEESGEDLHCKQHKVRAVMTQRERL